MNGRTRSVIASIAFTLITFVLSAGAVLAYGIESGTKYCTANGYPFTRGYTTGTTGIQAPGVPGGVIYNNGGTWTVRYAHKTTPGGGGQWVVETDGQLNDAGTYAGCSI